jgi:hypothetical protein
MFIGSSATGQIPIAKFPTNNQAPVTNVQNSSEGDHWNVWNFGD